MAILGRALQPPTEAFLSRAGLKAGMRTLDLGCGGGDVTRLMAGVVGDADVVGIDSDPLVIAIAAGHPLDVGTRRRPRFLGPPGATIAVEDIDFAAHVCDPPSSAFDRFVELYQQTARAHGADPCIGPRLPDLLRSVGLVDVESTALVPRFTEGEGKLIAYLTFVQIQPSLVAWGLAHQSELRAISTELRRLGDDGWSMMSLAGIVQASGRIPAR